MFTLPALPYALDALEPAMSRETLEFHWGKHHQTYVNNLNGLIAGTDFEGKSLEEIIRTSTGGVFNNAAQVFNHTFFWQGLKPQGGGMPEGALLEAINAIWGSYDAFRKAFTASAAGNFGSGWTWLVKNADGTLAIVNTSNARHAAHGRSEAASRAGRLGARLLRRLPQRPSEVHRCVL